MQRMVVAYTAFVALVVALGAGMKAPEISGASGDAIWFLVLLASISLKIFLDDLSHFANLDPTDTQKAVHGFWASIVIWLLLLAAFVETFQRTTTAALLLALVFLTGLLWIIYNYLGVKDGSSQARRRHLWWALLNVVHIVALVSYASIIHSHSPPWGAITFGLQTALVVADAAFLGTVTRLARP